MVDAVNRKRALREAILAAREAMPAEYFKVAGKLITSQLLLMPLFLQAQTVLGYMNFGSEFETRTWVGQVLLSGRRLVLPRVNRACDELDLYVVTDLETQLVAGAWGIAEPVPERCERLKTLNEVEFALLPGVAFARDGARLGYGGGFYDKLLAHMQPRPVLVAAAFALQVVPQVPQEHTDVKIDWIVTEQEIVACSA